MAIIPRDEAQLVLDALINAGFTATITETKGGMLRQSQFTLFIAVKEPQLKTVCEIIKTNCTVKINQVENEAGQETIVGEGIQGNVGGAVLFIWDLNKVEIYRE